MEITNLYIYKSKFNDGDFNSLDIYLKSGLCIHFTSIQSVCNMRSQQTLYIPFLL